MTLSTLSSKPVKAGKELEAIMCMLSGLKALLVSKYTLRFTKTPEIYFCDLNVNFDNF